MKTWCLYFGRMCEHSGSNAWRLFVGKKVKGWRCDLGFGFVIGKWLCVYVSLIQYMYCTYIDILPSFFRRMKWSIKRKSGLGAFHQPVSALEVALKTSMVSITSHPSLPKIQQLFFSIWALLIPLNLYHPYHPSSIPIHPHPFPTIPGGGVGWNFEKAAVARLPRTWGMD